MVVIFTYLETHMSLLTRCNILSSLCNFYDGDIVVVALYINDETVRLLTRRNYCVLEIMCLTTKVVPRG
jgi:hypothetical protein